MTGRGISEEVTAELRSECLAVLQSHIRIDKCVETIGFMFTEVLPLVHSNEKREGVDARSSGVRRIDRKRAT